MLNRILNIAWKDLLHLWHNRLLLILVLFGAASEMLLIGWATGADVDDLTTVIVDYDDSTTSRSLIAALEDNDTFNLDDDAADDYRNNDDRDDALDDLFTSGNYVFNPEPVMLIEIPEGFEQQLQAGEQPEVLLTLNGAKALPSRTARRAAEEEILTFGAIERAKALAASESGQDVPVSAEQSAAIEQIVLTQLETTQANITVRYNEDLDRAHYTTPSEAAFVLYIMTIMAAALLLAREREYGTFEQLLVMPMRPFEIIIGKSISAMFVGYANFILLLGLMNVVFGVPVRGSLPLLLVLAIGYLFVELGRGFLVAMVTRTQNQALLVIMLIAFVDITFSGYAVPVESMPDVMQFVANFFPIRHWMIILRGILQKDIGLSVFWPQLVWLAGLGILINGATLWFFRRTLGEQR
ncbi:MAG: ABC transporter permease [Chloroflexi bacterium]|nr:ABC transporter permease [Chloroflexota bacterium]